MIAEPPRTLAVILLCLLGASVLASTPGRCADASSLKLLISVAQQSITAPFPARVTLHLRNAGTETLWLYRRARASAMEGALLAVELEPVGLPPSAHLASPAQGTVFEYVGLPRPRLVRLASGEDYEERATVGLRPVQLGTGGATRPLWGRYRLSVSYGAKYSNADRIARNVGVSPWQGQVSSNTVEIELHPPRGTGSVSGSVMDSHGRPVPRARVSLTDEAERLVNQLVTDATGRFAFTDLPLGLYWVTARREEESVDTATFRHVTLTSEASDGTLEIFLLPQDAVESKQFLHKPVLVRVTDASGRPPGKVFIESVWSTGTVLDTAKADVYEDGTAAMELIPGRNFVTLRKRGCPKQEFRFDVEPGDGIDAFKVTMECGGPG